MEGCIGYNGPAHGYRRQPGDGGQCSGSPDLDINPLQTRCRLFGRKFPCNGPARRAADHAEPVLPIQPVELVDHPINVIAEFRAARRQRFIGCVEARLRFVALEQGICDKAPADERFHRFALGGGETVACCPPGIGEKAEWAGSRDVRVELAQAARRRIAGICKGFAPRFGLAAIERGEILMRHVDLAAYLDARRPSRARQRFGNVGEHACIRCHILADPAIATGRGAAQSPLLISEVQAQPVDFRFAGERDRGIGFQPQEPPHPCNESAYIVGGECVFQREHGQLMLGFGEAGGRGGTDPVGRAVGTFQLGKPPLDRRVRARRRHTRHP